MPKLNLPNLKDIANVYSKNPNTAAAYKAGYDDRAKEAEVLKMERDTAIAQVRKLGYEIGEDYSPTRHAAKLKRECSRRTSCQGCEFMSIEQGCALKGRPRDWPIIG